MTDIIARIRKTDRRVVRIHDDGSEDVLVPRPMRPMTEAEIEAAAAADPDARPMSAEQLASPPRVSRVKTMRRALMLTQEEFAELFHIPLGTLRDWEQGRSEPDQPARAYLKVIAADPEAVTRALTRQPRSGSTINAAAAMGADGD